VELVWTRAATSRSEAQKFEAQTRRLSRRDKLRLIAGAIDDNFGKP
jgi:predicted GIY-YIG superfamily endonuclease